MQPLAKRLAAANALLAPYAVPLEGRLDREHPESEDETRFPFQRDRDRIIHTQAFRRLKGKTQVFVASLRQGYGRQVGKGDLSGEAPRSGAESDHYRTRLTHTMEVAQISRDMARTLGLNEDLAECIALAHDLGHTPFGHAGEDAMREEMARHSMTYEHNEQSLRIVTLLEERTKRYPGLNLNQEILEGLMKHRTPFDEVPHFAKATRGKQDGPIRGPSLEAQIVNLADEIAYTAHDTDDGLRDGLFRTDDLLHIPLFAEAMVRAQESGTEVRGKLIHLLVTDAYEEIERRVHEHHIATLQGVYSMNVPLAAFSQEMHTKLGALRTFLWEHLYNAQAVLEHAERGKEIVHTLFRTYEKNPPPKVCTLQKKTGSTPPEAIKDYIAGMTDSFAEAMASRRGESL